MEDCSERRKWTKRIESATCPAGTRDLDPTPLTERECSLACILVVVSQLLCSHSCLGPLREKEKKMQTQTRTRSPSMFQQDKSLMALPFETVGDKQGPAQPFCRGSMSTPKTKHQSVKISKKYYRHATDMRQSCGLGDRSQNFNLGRAAATFDCLSSIF